MKKEIIEQIKFIVKFKLQRCYILLDTIMLTNCELNIYFLDVLAWTCSTTTSSSLVSHAWFLIIQVKLMFLFNLKTSEIRLFQINLGNNHEKCWNVIPSIAKYLHSQLCSHLLRSEISRSTMLLKYHFTHSLSVIHLQRDKKWVG